MIFKKEADEKENPLIAESEKFERNIDLLGLGEFDFILLLKKRPRKRLAKLIKRALDLVKSVLQSLKSATEIKVAFSQDQGATF